MTRTMLDAVTAANIPTTATMVAGYCDTIKIPQWTAADWARFPHATQVRIAKKATTNDGHVLDVETGDATPTQAPNWVLLRRRSGADPTVYCNASTWASVIAAFRAAGVAQPHYWIASYPGGGAVLPTEQGITAVAHQYLNGSQYDTSVVADVWPGVDSQEDDMNADQDTELTGLWEAMFTGSHTATATYPALLAIEAETQRRVTAMATAQSAAIAALAAKVGSGDDTATVVKAVQDAIAAAVVKVDVSVSGEQAASA